MFREKERESFGITYIHLRMRRGFEKREVIVFMGGSIRDYCNMMQSTRKIDVGWDTVTQLTTFLLRCDVQICDMRRKPTKIHEESSFCFQITFQKGVGDGMGSTNML